MPSSLKTSIIVRPQAHGGKFLGDDIGGALITIKDAQTGTLLAEGLTQGGSGQLKPDYGNEASLTAIVTPGKAPIWVHAPTGTSQFCAELSSAAAHIVGNLCAWPHRWVTKRSSCDSVGVGHSRPEPCL